jgi:hypothetical protein
MKLSIDDIKQFYRIWFPLLHFANQQLNVVPSFPDEWGDDSVDTQDVATIRTVLWEDDTNGILDEFIQQNLFNLADDDLAIANQWKYRISDTFFMFRYLKKYTVFVLEGEPSRAYGVLGITSSFEEMFGKALPLYAQTTLLPFKGKIIYDSLILPYSIYFGGGIKSSLNDTYRGVQEREGIIDTLPFDSTVTDTKQLTKSNKKILRAFEKQLGKSGISPQKTIEHSENIAQYADYLFTEFTPSIFLLDINSFTINAYIQQSPKKVNLVSFKRFIRFLRDTYRIYDDDAEDILIFLKTQ